jgi:hypothetical protein
MGFVGKEDNEVSVDEDTEDGEDDVEEEEGVP